MRLAQLVVLALVTLVLALFVLRPMFLRPPPDASDDQSPSANGLSPRLVGSETATSPALDGIVETGPLDATDPGALASGAQSARDRGSAAELQDAPPVERLRALIEDRREETMEILSSWLDDEQERA